MLRCIYCFEAFKAENMGFRCNNGNPSLCQPVEDTEYQRYHELGTPPLHPKVIHAASSRGVPRGAVCTCGVFTDKAVCPECHNELPHQFGMTKSFTIALVGSKDAGKSHYIAVLINELKNTVGDLFNASITALSDETISRYNRDFRHYIYDKNEVIPGTTSGRTSASGVRIPLVYRLNIASKKRFSLFGDRLVDIVFFDTAGEDLENLNLMRAVNKYIGHAGGLIFLLDPLQVDGVRESLAQRGVSYAPPSQSLDQADIVNRSILLIQQIRQMQPDTRIDIPAAVTFTKTDALRPLLESDFPQYFEGGRHNGYLDLDDTMRTNDMFTGYLDSWFGPNLRRTLEHDFGAHSVFGVSALGSSPDTEGKIKRGVSPFRVEDPLLWILYKKGIIEGKRNGGRIIGGIEDPLRSWLRQFRQTKGNRA